LANDTGTKLSFLKKTTVVEPSVSPEALFGDLPKLPTGVPALWSHQADQLRTYFDKHKTSANVALELPTGSGKTLVGLLIAEWRRRTLGQRVVYACPTIQLARQVAKAAADQGIPATCLVGKSAEWDVRDFQKYVSGQAVAVTVYSHIFNTNPRFDDAQTLLFDDAHAAENYVAEAWSIDVKHSESLFRVFLGVVADSLDAQLVTRLNASEDGGRLPDSTVRLLPASVIAAHASDIETAFAKGLKDNRKYSLSWLKENLTSCAFFISGRGLYVRPMIPPTSSHAPFTAPEQRIYLSATLGDSGELERAFGVARIKRVPVPDEWNRTGSGRRFFVFPDLANFEETPDYDNIQLTMDILRQAEKKLVLTPSQAEAEKIAEELGVSDQERFEVKQGTDFSDFREARKGTLLAANRYDGMDLAGDACRLMLMLNLPSYSHDQDTFIDERLGAKQVLAERIRTRVVQGFGRCTRGPRDYSVVVVAGDDLVNYLSRKENLEAMPVELQAEIAFGRAASDNDSETLQRLVKSALAQDELWQREAEPAITSARAKKTRVSTDASSQLGATAASEVLAWQAAWSQNWEVAGTYAQTVFEGLKDPSLKPYRALWAYHAASWLGLANSDSEAALKSAAFLREAQLAASGTTWLRETLPAATKPVAEHMDRGGVDGVIGLLRGHFSRLGKYDTTVASMVAGLQNIDSNKYEGALVQLGEFLGAKSYKPAFEGRTDAAWIWPELWITVEAKSEQESKGAISMDYIRQTDSQLDSLASDERVEEVPEASISLIVSPRLVVKPDAVPIARDHVFLGSPANILALAIDTDRAWKQLRNLETTQPDLAGAVERIMWSHQILPSQIRERLTLRKVR
jgi:hypothetical protein